MRSLVHGLVIAATLGAGLTAALAQDDELAQPAQKEAAPAQPEAAQAEAANAEAPADGSGKRKHHHHHRNRYTEYWEHRAALESAVQGSAPEAGAAGTPAAPAAAKLPAETPPAPAKLPAEPSPVPAHVAEVHAPAPEIDAGIDGGIDGGLDAQPAIAAVHEPPAPAHEHALPASATERGAAHGESAEHGEHAGFKVSTFVLQLINFGVLLFLLIYFGGRAMNKSLRARHEQLKGELAEAARLRDEAKQKVDAQERRLADLEKELSALRASMRQDAAREQARLLEGAQERAKKIQEEMRFQLDQQVKEAEMLLRAEVANASVKLAEALVSKAVDTQDERRLAQEFVAGFDSPTAGGAR